MSEAALAGAAQATPPDANIQTNAAAEGPQKGPSSFQDYIASLPENDPGRVHAQKKGWKDWGDPIKAHENAERAIGDKIALPKPGDTDALKAHMTKLAPQDGKYELNYEADGITVDEGVKGTFEAWLKDNPLPNATAQSLIALWNGMAKGAHESAAAAQAAKIEAKDKALDTLRGEWGNDKFEQQMDLATKAAALAGWDSDLLNAMEETLPGATKSFIEGLARIGSLGTEDQFVEGHGGTAPKDAKRAENVLWPNLA